MRFTAIPSKKDVGSLGVFQSNTNLALSGTIQMEHFEHCAYIIESPFPSHITNALH